MRKKQTVLAGLIALLTIVATSVRADIFNDMQSISRFCLYGLETGQVTDELLRNGFKQRGRKFKKSYNKSVIGGSNPVISVELRNTRSGLECSSSFVIISRNDGRALFRVAEQATRQAGFADTTAFDRKGRRIPALVKNGMVIRIGGSTSSSHSSYSASIHFDRLN